MARSFIHEDKPKGSRTKTYTTTTIRCWIQSCYRTTQILTLHTKRVWAKTNGRNFVSNGRHSTIYPNDIPNPVNQGGIDF